VRVMTVDGLILEVVELNKSKPQEQ
jgi:hypothetical protein